MSIAATETGTATPTGLVSAAVAATDSGVGSNFVGLAITARDSAVGTESFLANGTGVDALSATGAIGGAVEDTYAYFVRGRA